jgi:Mor family transcriptional regulator
VKNVVVAPINLSGRRKTDKRDARKLVEALERYVGGNAEAFSVVTVPLPKVIVASYSPRVGARRRPHTPARGI